MSTSDTAKMVRDPDWYVHRYDPQRDLYHYIAASRQMRRRAPFLIDEYLREAGGIVPISRRDALLAAPPLAAPGFIFHSAFCCSTLLANALELPGVAMTLKEPVVLNDLSGWQRRGGPVDQARERTSDAVKLLSANTAPSERLIIKPSNVTNALIPLLLASHEQSSALFIHAPIETFVASIASKGMQGRLWVRELWMKLSADGLCGLGFGHDAPMGWTDLQVAAMGWLAQHRLFSTLAVRLDRRVKTVDSATLLEDPPRSIRAICELFGLALDDDQIRHIAKGPAFTRNSKTGGAFGRNQREATHQLAREAHGEEIEKVVAWTRAVAEANDIPLTLPNALLH